MLEESKLAEAIAKDYFELVKEIEGCEVELPLPDFAIGLNTDMNNIDERTLVAEALEHYSSVSRKVGQFNPYVVKAVREYKELRQRVEDLDKIRQELLNEILRMKNEKGGDMPLFNLSIDEDGKEYYKEIPLVTGTFEFSLDDLEI